MRINSVIIVTLLFFSTFTVYGQIQKINVDTLVNGLGSRFVKNDQSFGLSIGIYTNGKTHFYNYGTTDKNNINTPTENSIYEVGSITKAFVSLVLANAVIEKKVKLTDDIRKYLPGNYPNLEYKKTPITLLELSNTTSRLPNWLPNMKKEITNTTSDSTAQVLENTGYVEKDMLQGLHTVVLDTIPGTKSAHSNGAALVLSYILERVYHEPIEALVRKYVLNPATMKNTSFLAAKSNPGLLVTGYDGKKNQMPYFSTPFLKGVGGLSSNTSDLVKFIQLQLDTTQSAVNLSHQKTFNNGWANIGLTWLMYRFDDGNHQLWADGGTYGFTSYVIIYPELNSGIAVLSNEADPSSSDRVSDIADSIFRYMSKP